MIWLNNVKNFIKLFKCRFTTLQIYTVESRTHLKTVKITSNIFAVHRHLLGHIVHCRVINFKGLRFTCGILSSIQSKQGKGISTIP